MRSKHFPTEELLNLIENKLESVHQAVIESHLAECQKCGKQLAQLTDITGLMKKDRSYEAPQDSIKWAKNIFLTRTPKIRSSVVKKIFGILQMNLSQTQAFAERSSALPVRQMLYRADENTLDIRVIKGDKNNTIAGQILGDDFSGCETQLRQKGKSVMATINDMNEFRFSRVESGKYKMVIRKEKIELILDDLEF